MPEPSSRSATVVVLAAGLGKRLKSKLPKVLHPVCGRPALWHVLRAAGGARPARIVVVVHHGREQVEEAVRSWGVRPEPVFVDQSTPLGTGHAVMVAEPAVGQVSDVVVLAGDDPLISSDHVRRLVGVHRRSKAAATILTTTVDDPTGYWRVTRRGTELVELGAEADPQATGPGEIATLAYSFRRGDLFEALPLVDRQNRQSEYYLPDTLHILRDKGLRLSAAHVDAGGALGVNSRAQLTEVNRVMRERIVREHAARGVTFLDPLTAYVDVGVRIGPETVIHPMTFLEGKTRIGGGCEIGPSTRIVDSRVGNGSAVQFSVVRGARIGRRASIGPFAHVRPGTVLADGAKAGSFVEIKASRIGAGSKVPHLSYVGDATVGRNTNIGAGTVTVNYDGWDKHRTVIGDEVKIGSDTMLVAPVKVGRRAMTGAGSVVTKDVPAGALAIERAEQRNVPGFRDRKERRKAAERRAGRKAGDA
jgi:bifunctional UDP-N-acetylglucosamine pyrophosphorylase / glucosamine-1-phosphate N-acetyltransferase